VKRIPVVALALMPLALLLVGAAQADAVSTKSPFAQSVYISCANGGDGEIIDFTGVFHDLVSSALDKNGKLHINWQETISGKAVGTESGDQFNFSQRWVWNFQDYHDFDAKVYQDILTFRLIGKGHAPNLHAYAWVKRVYNAKGELKVEILRVEPLCP
jgi:hypothetical protein